MLSEKMRGLVNERLKIMEIKVIILLTVSLYWYIGIRKALEMTIKNGETTLKDIIGSVFAGMIVGIDKNFDKVLEKNLKNRPV